MDGWDTFFFCRSILTFSLNCLEFLDSEDSKNIGEYAKTFFKKSKFQMQLLLKMLIIYLMIDVFMIGWFMEQFQQKVQFKKKRSAIVLTNHLLLFLEHRAFVLTMKIERYFFWEEKNSILLPFWICNFSIWNFSAFGKYPYCIYSLVRVTYLYCFKLV